MAEPTYLRIHNCISGLLTALSLPQDSRSLNNYDEDARRLRRHWEGLRGRRCIGATLALAFVMAISGSLAEANISVSPNIPNMTVLAGSFHETGEHKALEGEAAWVLSEITVATSDSDVATAEITDKIDAFDEFNRAIIKFKVKATGVSAGTATLTLKVKSRKTGETTLGEITSRYIQRTFSVTVNADLMPTLTGTIADQELTQGKTYTSASAFPEATGGDGTLSYSVASLPTGITLNSDRKLTGTATAPLAKTVLTYKVTDSDSDTDTLTFNFSVKPKSTTLSGSAGDQQVSLNWAAIDGVTKWQYQQGSSGNWTDVTSSSDTTNSHTVTGLTDGTEYAFKVRAVIGTNANAVNGVESNELLITPGVPDKPTGLAVESVHTKANLTWTAIVGITKWQVRYKRVSNNYGSWSDISGSSATTTSHTVTNLTKGSKYEFQIRAVNNHGIGVASDAVAAVWKPESPIITLNSVESPGKIEINLESISTWSNSCPYGNTNSFQIVYWKGAAADENSATQITHYFQWRWRRNISIQNLEVGEMYSFKVRTPETVRYVGGNRIIVCESSDYSEVKSIFVPAVDPRVLSIVRQDPSGSPTNSDTIKWRVTFDEDVKDISEADFEVSGTTATLAVAQVDSSKSVYDLTASGGDLTNYNGTVTLSFANNQDIKDLADNDLTITLPVNTNENSYILDNTAPTVTIEDVPDKTNVAFTAKFTFSEAVTGFEVGDITLTGATASAFTETTTGIIWTAKITPNADYTVSVSADAVQDAAGNGNTASDTESGEVVPSVTITGVPATINAAFTATFTFSEAITGFEVGDITLTGATASAFTNTVTGTTWTATITPSANYSVSVAVDVAVDVDNNGNTASETKSGIYDAAAPNVVITGVPDTTRAAFTAKFTFSEAVTGFEISDITLTGATASAFTNTVEDTTWTAMIAPSADYTVSVSANAATDKASNGNTAATKSGTYDAIPSVMISGVPTITNRNFIATFTFSESVTGFVVDDIDLTGAIVSIFTETETGTTWTARISPLDEGDYSVSVSADVATDADNNGNTASETKSGIYDTRVANIVITGVPDKTSAAFTAKFTFSEPVTGFEISDITLTGATASAFTNKVKDTTWTAMITPSADYTVSVSANTVTDKAGNGNVAVTKSGTYDTTIPSVTISGVPAATNEAFTATFTFSKAVTGFVVGDITLTGATASAFTNTVTGTTWTATITPSADYSVSVSADVVTDTAGNGNTASAVASGVYDVTSPTVDITGVPATTGTAFTATFTFSETVTGFVVGDITLTGATASAFTETDTGVTWTAMITPSADYSVSVSANVVTDEAGNGNTAATKSGTYDATKPSVTISGVPSATNAAFTATFTFSEAVTGFVVGDITLTGATASAFTETVTDTTWTATITPSADYSVSVSANAVTDKAGNGNAAATKSGTYDITIPSVTISGVPAATNAAFTATFTFSEAITGFVVDDITLTGATASAFTNTVTDTTWTATITPSAGYSVSVAANVATDTDSKGNTASAVASGVYDVTSPTVNITGVPATTGTAFTATFTFSEPVSGFEIGDITLTGATASAFTNTTTGTTWTALVTPLADGAYSVVVSGNVAMDAAGNGNAASNTARGTQIFDSSGQAERRILKKTLAAVARANLFDATDTISRRFAAQPCLPDSNGNRRGNGANSALCISELTLGGRDATPVSGFEPGARMDLQSQVLAAEDLRTGSAFAVSSNDQSSGSWTVWGRVGQVMFEKRRDAEGTFDGNLTTGWLGADTQLGNGLLAGVAISRANSEVDYRSDGVGGRLETGTTTIYPYVWADTGAGEFWAVIGAGDGEARQKPQAGNEEKRNLYQLLGSAGLLRPLSRFGDFDVLLKGDAGLVRLDTDGDPSSSALAGLGVESWWLRGGIEARHRGIAKSDNAILAPFGSLIVRHEGGDGVTGSGVELAGGARYSIPGSRLELEASGHWLALHSDNGYREWSTSAQIQMSPGTDGSGMSMSIGTNWGTSQQITDGLWQDRVFERDGLAKNHAEGSLNARIGYGFGIPGLSGLVTPFTELELAGSKNRARFGFDFDQSKTSGLSMSLAVERVETVAASDNRIGLEVRILNWSGN